MLSVIVPVYNTADYLDECVESILSQRAIDIEVILIDDCSTDGSSELVDAWSARDSRVKALHNQGNMGVSHSRNRGLSASAGDYIAFVDSDDWIDGDYHVMQVRQLEASGADICLAGYTRHEHGRVIPVHVRAQEGKECGREEALSICMPQRGEGRNNLFIVDKVFHKRVLAKESKSILFDPTYSYGEDVLWVMGVFLNSERFVCCDVCGYHYRTEREGNTWSRMRRHEDLSLCESSLETNRQMYELLVEAESKSANNQLQRLLAYQARAFRTAAKLGDVDAFRAYAKGYVPTLLKWYAGNRSFTGLKWLVRRLASHAKFLITLTIRAKES